MKPIDKVEVRYLLTSHKNALVFVSPLCVGETAAQTWLEKAKSKIDGGLGIQCTRRPYTNNEKSISFVDENTNAISHLYMNSWKEAFEYNGCLFLVDKFIDKFDKKTRIKFMVYKVQGI